MAATLIVDAPDAILKALDSQGVKEVSVVNVRRRTTKMTRDQVAKRLPVWLRKYKIALAVDSQRITLAERDFLFRRESGAMELKKVQATIVNTRSLIHQYQVQEAKTNVQLNEIKEKLAKRIKGVDVDEVRREALTWPGVLDVLFGPAVDPITGLIVATGTFIITFLPVAYLGTDMGYPAAAWAVSNPIRFLVKEDGTVYGVGTSPTTSYHPHLLENRLCGGNLMKPFGVMVRENSVLGAIGVLNEWRIGHGEGHYQDHDWMKKAWRWWDEVFVHPSPARNPAAWMFDGRWDGRTIQLSTKDGINTLTNIEEFFGGPMEAIVHVGLAKNYIKPDDVKAYCDAIAKGGVYGKPCRACGRPNTGCPCHTTGCGGCGKNATVCTCRPLEGHAPPPKTFTIDTIIYKLAPVGYYCEHEDPKTYNLCRAPAAYGRNCVPYFVCDEHLPADAKKYLDEYIGKAVKKLAQGEVIPDPARGPTTRHNHKHAHEGGLEHTHHHEHFRADAVTERITEHDSNHTVYSKGEGYGVRRTKHEAIK